MATSTPTQPPSTVSRNELIHNVSWGALIICPIIIALPPRKVDIYTLCLLSGMFLGGNQLSKEYTGISMLERMGHRMESMSSTSLPPKAIEMQKRLREEKLMREGGGQAALGQAGTNNTGLSRLGEGAEEARIQDRSGESGGVLKELARQKDQEKSGKERGLLEKVWMGGEPDDWKAKRDQKEKEALEEGRGYGGLIMDQIWEVWSWGKEKSDEVKEMDEKVLADEKRLREKKAALGQSGTGNTGLSQVGEGDGGGEDTG